MGQVNARVKSVGENHLVTSLDLRESNVFQLAENKTWEDLRGMGGGPVFMWHNVSYEVAGVVYEDLRSLDLIRVRLVHMIQPDGALRGL